MNAHLPPVSENDLHAYVDDQLDPARRAAVEAYLAEHPDEATRVQGYRLLNESLLRGFEDTFCEPVPPELLQRRRAQWPRRVAAAAGWLTLGVLFGWGLGSPRDAIVTDGAPVEAVSLVHDASLAHAVYTVEVRHPVEVGADQEAHLSAWLSKRLDGTLRPPPLGAIGYDLVGGRLLPADSGAAAQFMYENATGQRLTLYVRRTGSDSEATAFRYEMSGQVGVFYWIDGRFGYALSGELPREQLLQAAQVTYQGLNP